MVKPCTILSQSLRTTIRLWTLDITISILVIIVILHLSWLDLCCSDQSVLGIDKTIIKSFNIKISLLPCSITTFNNQPPFRPLIKYRTKGTHPTFANYDQEDPTSITEKSSAIKETGSTQIMLNQSNKSVGGSIEDQIAHQNQQHITKERSITKRKKSDTIQNIKLGSTEQKQRNQYE